jgi:large subunit ribosomal protein L25
MAEMKLTASKREALGKKVKNLRGKGMTPAHLFGHGLESQVLQCDTTELMKILNRAGTTRLVSLNVEGDKESHSVFVREIQRDVMSRQLLHVDFYQVRKDEKMQMDVPIVFIGEAPAMRGKGRLISKGISELRIECLPEKVPPQIEVDIAPLTDLDKSLHVKDIIMPADILVKDDPDQLIAKVAEIIIKVEEEKPTAEAAAAAAAAGEAGAEGAEAGAEGETKAEGAAGKPAAGKPVAGKTGAEAGADKKPADKKAPAKKE